MTELLNDVEIRQAVREELDVLHDRWLVTAASLLAVLIGMGAFVFGSPLAQQLLAVHGAWIGPTLIAFGVAGGVRLARRQYPLEHTTKSRLNRPRPA